MGVKSVPLSGSETAEKHPGQPLKEVVSSCLRIAAKQKISTSSASLVVTPAGVIALIALREPLSRAVFEKTFIVQAGGDPAVRFEDQPKHVQQRAQSLRKAYWDSNKFGRPRVRPVE